MSAGTRHAAFRYVPVPSRYSYQEASWLVLAIPVPKPLLVLGPDDPAVLAWLWENWGTTWMLRGVEEVPVGLPIPQDHGGVSYRFWSADWTPWRALSAVRTRWPALTLHITMRSVAE